jgi:lipoprotein-anchoring transpeptidase ErfK/SrfK
MGAIPRTWAIFAALAAALLAAASGDAPNLVMTSAALPSPSAPPLTIALTPTDGTQYQPVSTEIGVAGAGTAINGVSVSTASGTPVAGALRDDGSAWMPTRPLAYATSYRATAVLTSPNGRVTTATTRFTTMARPSSFVTSGLYLFDGRTYGVAMPVVAEFSPGVPAADRAAVQRRMFVRTDPPQPGAWHWLPDGTQAYYRAPHYWKPQTTISVRLALEGIPLSNDRYGRRDHIATARIGRAFEMWVDNTTKTMTVYEDGTQTRIIPVSLGKRSTPSSSGTMVVMDKLERTIFDTRDEPDPANRYVVEIDHAQRLTWDGEFIHAAPWSVDALGRRNVSHGCLNVSTENAEWLFAKTKIGDPVTVVGTERRIASGNGWTAWNLSWPDFAAGSALPVPAGLD